RGQGMGVMPASHIQTRPTFSQHSPRSYAVFIPACAILTPILVNFLSERSRALLLFGNFTLEGIISIVLAALIGMTIHEFAHNYVGYLMGDPVPAQQGRLTLDPRVHINWFGFAMFILIGFGILGQAPIS